MFITKKYLDAKLWALKEEILGKLDAPQEIRFVPSEGEEPSTSKPVGNGKCGLTGPYKKRVAAIRSYIRRNREGFTIEDFSDHFKINEASASERLREFHIKGQIKRKRIPGKGTKWRYLYYRDLGTKQEGITW